MYELKNGKIDLIYIGSSGKVQNNGHQFRKTPRKESWKQKLVDEKIEALDIYWYDTINSETKDIPVFAEATIMQRFFDTYGHLPHWYQEF